MVSNHLLRQREDVIGHPKPYSDNVTGSPKKTLHIKSLNFYCPTTKNKPSHLVCRILAENVLSTSSIPLFWSIQQNMTYTYHLCMVYLPTWKPYKSTIHVGKYTIFPCILWDMQIFSCHLSPPTAKRVLHPGALGRAVSGSAETMGSRAAESPPWEDELLLMGTKKFLQALRMPQMVVILPVPTPSKGCQWNSKGW